MGVASIDYSSLSTTKTVIQNTFIFQLTNLSPAQQAYIRNFKEYRVSRMRVYARPATNVSSDQSRFPIMYMLAAPDQMFEPGGINPNVITSISDVLVKGAKMWGPATNQGMTIHPKGMLTGPAQVGGTTSTAQMYTNRTLWRTVQVGSGPDGTLSSDYYGSIGIFGFYPGAGICNYTCNYEITATIELRGRAFNQSVSSNGSGAFLQHEGNDDLQKLDPVDNPTVQ